MRVLGPQVVVTLAVFLTLTSVCVDSYATVGYGAVNHVTKECGLLETGSLYTPIGWKSCGQECYDRTERYCEELNYTYVDRNVSYRIEAVIGLFAFILVVAVWAWRRRR